MICPDGNITFINVKHIYRLCHDALCHAAIIMALYIICFRDFHNIKKWNNHGINARRYLPTASCHRRWIMSHNRLFSRMLLYVSEITRKWHSIKLTCHDLCVIASLLFRAYRLIKCSIFTCVILLCRIFQPFLRVGPCYSWKWSRNYIEGSRLLLAIPFSRR